MKKFLVNSGNKIFSAIGSRLGYYSAPIREKLEITPAILGYIDAGLLQSEDRVITKADLEQDEILRKAKLLNLLPDPLLRLMTLNKTQTRLYSHHLEPNTGGYFPVKIQFGWWQGKENRITLYETADQILGLGARRFVPLLNVIPKMKDIPAVFSLYQRCGFRHC